MFPIRREAAGYAFKRSLRLHAQNAVHQEYGGGYISALLETTLQVLIIFLPLCHLETLIWRLVTVGEGISVPDTHIMNTILTSMAEVAYQQVSLLL